MTYTYEIEHGMVYFEYEYSGNTPVEPGDAVDLLDHTGHQYDRCLVVDALASQFTVLRGKQTKVFFYADKGVTWRRATSKHWRPGK